MNKNGTAGKPLDGKVALVSGGGTGLGRAIAIRLSDGGARTVLVGRRNEKIIAACAEINSKGGDSISIRGDITKQSDIESIVRFTERECGRIDILVNNAGVAIPRRDITEISRDEWDLVMDVNFNAVFFLSQAVVKVMRKYKGGRIVNISSTVALSPRRNIIPYSVSKGAVISLTRTMALDLAPDGINVNAVAPGYVPTDINVKLLNDPQQYQEIIQRIPLKRIGKAEEIAGAVFYLVSPETEYVTGQTICVDGGWTMA